MNNLIVKFKRNLKDNFELTILQNCQLILRQRRELQIFNNPKQTWQKHYFSIADEKKGHQKRATHVHNFRIISCFCIISYNSFHVRRHCSPLFLLLCGMLKVLYCSAQHKQHQQQQQLPPTWNDEMIRMKIFSRNTKNIPPSSTFYFVLLAQ